MRGFHPGGRATATGGPGRRATAAGGGRARAGATESLVRGARRCGGWPPAATAPTGPRKRDRGGIRRGTTRPAGVRTAPRGHAVDHFPLATHGNSATQALRAVSRAGAGRVRDRCPVGAGPLNSGCGTGRSGLCVDRLFRWVRPLRMFHVEHVCDGFRVGTQVHFRVRACVCAGSASTSVLLRRPGLRLRQVCLYVSSLICMGVGRAAGPSCGSATGARLGIRCRTGRWVSAPELLRGCPPVCVRWIVPVTALLGADLSRAWSVSGPSLVGSDRAVTIIGAVKPNRRTVESSNRRKSEVR